MLENTGENTLKEERDGESLACEMPEAHARAKTGIDHDKKNMLAAFCFAKRDGCNIAYTQYSFVIDAVALATVLFLGLYPAIETSAHGPMVRGSSETLILVGIGLLLLKSAMFFLVNVPSFAENGLFINVSGNGLGLGHSHKICEAAVTAVLGLLFVSELAYSASVTMLAEALSTSALAVIAVISFAAVSRCNKLDSVPHRDDLCVSAAVESALALGKVTIAVHVALALSDLVLTPFVGAPGSLFAIMWDNVSYVISAVVCYNHAMTIHAPPRNAISGEIGTPTIGGRARIVVMSNGMSVVRFGGHLPLAIGGFLIAFSAWLASFVDRSTHAGNAWCAMTVVVAACFVYVSQPECGYLLPIEKYKSAIRTTAQRVTTRLGIIPDNCLVDSDA